jgi:hypothetical protein
LDLIQETMLVGKRDLKKRKRGKPQKLLCVLTSDCMLVVAQTEAEDVCKVIFLGGNGVDCLMQKELSVSFSHSAHFVTATS